MSPQNQEISDSWDSDEYNYKCIWITFVNITLPASMLGSLVRWVSCKAIVRANGQKERSLIPQAHLKNGQSKVLSFPQPRTTPNLSSFPFKSVSARLLSYRGPTLFIFLLEPGLRRWIVGLSLEDLHPITWLGEHTFTHSLISDLTKIFIGIVSYGVTSNSRKLSPRWILWTSKCRS